MLQKRINAFVCFTVLLTLLVIAGCSLKGIFSNEPATPADCAAIAAYIELCETEAAKDLLPESTRKWYALALAGARTEQAKKCAGVQ